MQWGSRLTSPTSSPGARGSSSPRSSARRRPSRYMTATWQRNVLVAATPISRPARVNSTPSASRVAWEPITLVTASTRRAALARQAHRGQRVRGLARLGDADHEVAGADDGVAVAVLGGDVHLDWQARPLLDRVAADQARVVGGAAGDDHDPLDVRAGSTRRAHPPRARSTPSPRAVRSAIASATASACSWISLSMKVS